ncbi:MAG: alkaline phosphatase [Anaerolineae bacterium]|nr:alkaline phosphatase [Anaerolineae bacterium]
MLKSKLLMAFALTLVLLPVIAGCATPTPQIVEVTKEVIVTEEVEVVVTKEVEVLITPTPEPEKYAKYVFLFIGDGMAVAQRNAAELYLAATAHAEGRPEDVDLLMNTFPAQGMNTTYDLTSVIPDSASTATAIASGYKTASGVIGMDSAGNVSYENIAEVAKANGWKVGIVSSVSIDHATPAAFYAHQPSRNNYREIGEALANSEFDYFAGGPLKRPATSNDKQTELPDLYDMARENGFTVAVGKAEFDALKPGGGKVFVIPDYKISGEALYYDMDNVPENNLSIVDLTRKGIELLDNPDGFFLMVEAGKIDWACHANDAAAAIHDTIAFDRAIAEAYEFYQAHPDETVIIVTGDHETGGMSIGFAGTQYSAFFDKVQHQDISYDEFNAQVAAWREAGDTKFEDTWPVIQEHFGLLFLTAEEIADLEAKAEAGDKEAEAQLGMALSELELDLLEQGFTRSMGGEEERATDEQQYLLYGGYEPYVIKLTHILNQKAGIAWTSYSHTGIPVQTSAIGVGAELFNGYYDQVDIHTKMMSIAGFSDAVAMASK